MPRPSHCRHDSECIFGRCQKRIGYRHGRPPGQTDRYQKTLEYPGPVSLKSVILYDLSLVLQSPFPEAGQRLPLLPPSFRIGIILSDSSHAKREIDPVVRSIQRIDPCLRKMHFIIFFYFETFLCLETNKRRRSSLRYHMSPAPTTGRTN